MSCVPIGQMWIHPEQMYKSTPVLHQDELFKKKTKKPQHFSFVLAELVEVQSFGDKPGKTAVDGASLTWDAFKGVSTCLLSESQTVPADDGFHSKTACFSVQHKGIRHRNEFRIVLIRQCGSDKGQRGRGWCGQQKRLQGSRDARLRLRDCM